MTPAQAYAIDPRYYEGKPGPKPRAVCKRGHDLTDVRNVMTNVKTARNRCRLCHRINTANWERAHPGRISRRGTRNGGKPRSDYFRWYYLTHDGAQVGFTLRQLWSVLAPTGREAVTPVALLASMEVKI